MGTSGNEAHENVLLISMSTLPRLPKYNTYKIKEGGRTLCFKGLSQLEPHTKYVLYKLALSQERLDRIVILESVKARTEKRNDWLGETATSFYKKRINDYLTGRHADAFDIQDPLSEEPETTLPAGFYSEKNAPEMIPIELENPVFFWNAIVKIRGNAERDNKKIHLYMDMQGGDRNTVAQMNAIVELLKSQGVIIKGRYANDYEPSKKTPCHTIRDAREEYRTYDLMSAMDAFTRYGWGDGLKDYFNGKAAAGSKEEKLIKAINKASVAISTCNADTFDNAIKDIGNLRRDFETGEASTQEDGDSVNITQMDVVFKDIKEDYAPLFDAKYRYVEQIRWCFRKKFVQQALTIFEAKMPYEFVHSGLLYYMTTDASEGERRVFLERCKRMFNRLRQNNRYKMKDLNHYLIKDYCKDSSSSFRDRYGILIFGLGEARKNEVISLLNEYRDLCKLRNQMNHAMAGNSNNNGFFRYMQAQPDADNIWSNNTETDYEEEIRKYLDKWERLANDEALNDSRDRILDLS